MHAHTETKRWIISGTSSSSSKRTNERSLDQRAILSFCFLFGWNTEKPGNDNLTRLSVNVAHLFAVVSRIDLAANDCHARNQSNQKRIYAIIRLLLNRRLILVTMRIDHRTTRQTSNEQSEEKPIDWVWDSWRILAKIEEVDQLSNC